MKLTAIFLFAACLTVTARTAGQTVTLDVKNVSVKEVFKAIQQQTGLNVLVDESLIDKAGNVTLSVTNMPVDKVLNLCFRDASLEYHIGEGAVTITEKAPEVTKDESSATIDVHGHITNEKGEPVEGATITVKASRRISTTNANGQFTLAGINSDATLIITFVGYETQEIKLNGQSDITLQLKIKVTSEEDVIINKGYYTTTQRLNTGDVVKVDGSDLAKQPVTDPIVALQGRVAGLNIVQSSGVPGASSTIRLRGDNTILQGKLPTANDPLFIVDGVPFSSQTNGGGNGGLTVAVMGGGGLSPFNSINPNDIESIEVLKDADATAIYGSRGANGVILISTKKGKVGPARVRVGVTTGVNMQASQLHLMNTKQYLQMIREGVVNDGISQYVIPQYAQYYPDLLVWDTTRYTNWQKVLLDKPQSFTNANASISGGTNAVQYIMGVDYSRNGATVPGNFADQRAGVHSAVTTNSLNQRFRTQLSVSYSYDENNLPKNGLSSFLTLAPDAPPIYDDKGNLNWSLYQGSNTWINPYAWLLHKQQAATEFLNGSFNMAYEMVKGLKIESSFGYSHSETNQFNYEPASAQPPPDNTNPNYRNSAFATMTLRNWVIEPKLSYQHHFGKGNLDVLIGATFQSLATDSRSQGASGFSSDNLIPDIAAATTVSKPQVGNSLNRQGDIYFRAGYDWDQKYLLNLTGRRDGSSRFGPGKQFGNFGAVGAGWIISEEKWMKSIHNTLSFAKLRGSYGVTGSDAIPDYQFLRTYGINRFSYQGVTGLTPTGLSNSNLRWEQNRKLEFGLELGFLKDRVHLTANWYQNRTGNQLVSYPLPLITGFGSVVSNLPALIQNRGIEFTLNTVNVKTKNFTWSTMANIAHNRNKLVSFPGIEQTPYNNFYFVGRSLSVAQFFHYTGVDPQTGVYTFASKDGTGAPNYTNNPVTNDRNIFKDMAPSYFGAMENSFTYKHLSISFMLRFAKQTGEKYSSLFLMPGTLETNQPIEVLSRWEKPGDISGIQKASLFGAQDAYNHYQFSDGVLTDASFIRLQTVNVSYQLPDNWQKKAHLQGASIFLNVQNLFTITKYDGLDPETGSATFSPLRTIVGGIQISL